MLDQFLILDYSSLVRLWNVLEVDFPSRAEPLGDKFVLFAVQVQMGFVVSSSDVVSDFYKLQG